MRERKFDFEIYLPLAVKQLSGSRHAVEGISLLSQAE